MALKSCEGETPKSELEEENLTGRDWQEATMVELLLLSNLPKSPGRDGANYQSLKMVKAQDRCVAWELDDQVKAVLMHHTGIHQQRPWF